MTWVVAGNTAFFPLMAGDVCVSFPTAGGVIERDCLLKIYSMAPNIVAGFAGSVRAGLLVLGTIQSQLHADQLYSLPRAAHSWMPRLMRRVFRALPEHERAQHCQVLMMGAHPELESGYPGVPRSHVVRFVSPEFAPEVSIERKFIGIGSGADVEAYRTAAEEVLGGYFLERAIQAGWHAPAQHLADHLHRTVGQAPRSGVSRHFVYATVSRGGALIAPHTYTIHAQDGQETPVGPPPIARGYPEFIAYCRANGLAAAAATAAIPVVATP